jgi:hypothetical protein
MLAFLSTCLSPVERAVLDLASNAPATYFVETGPNDRRKGKLQTQLRANQRLHTCKQNQLIYDAQH